MRKFLLLTGLALLLLALPVAADSVIYSGIDLWKTTDDGTTQTNFADNAIPADFFCSGSEPFTGLIQFRGVSLVTRPGKVLGNTDTIVHRLDDAFFDAKGAAYTRVQVRALAFESMAPVETVCGSFDVTVTLDGEQPITKMEILRDSAEGGRFFSPISVIIKLSFVATDGGKHEPLVISKRLDFKAMDDGRWTENPGKSRIVAKSFVVVDTDADGEPDTYLPGTSNFNPSSNGPAVPGQKLASNNGCHCDFATCGHLHCIGVPIDDGCGGGGSTNVQICR